MALTLEDAVRLHKNVSELLDIIVVRFNKLSRHGGCHAHVKQHGFIKDKCNHPKGDGFCEVNVCPLLR